jgi:hypothetical protein
MCFTRNELFSQYARKLKVWHYNVRKTYQVQKRLLQLAGEHQVDVVVVVEACPKTNGFPDSIVSHGYKLAFDFQETNTVAFYVRNEMDIQHWKPTRHSDYKATITVETDFDIIHFHGFYIPPEKISSWSIDDIVEVLQAEGQHVMMGDFNLHHTWWAGDDLPKDKIRPLAEAFYSHFYGDDWTLANEQGLHTWERSPGHDQRSVIDLMVLSAGKCTPTINNLLKEFDN